MPRPDCQVVSLDMNHLPSVRKGEVPLGHPGLSYWTLYVGDLLEPIPLMDRFLHDEVAVGGKAKGTSKTYAQSLSPLAKYMTHFGQSFVEVAKSFDAYLIWRRKLIRATKGRGDKYGASAKTINAELEVIARLYDYGMRRAEQGEVDPTLRIDPEVRDLIIEVIPEGARLRAARYNRRDGGRVVRCRYAVRVGAVGADDDRRRRSERPKAATDEEFLAVLEACRSARDLFAFSLMRSPGLRASGVSTLKRDRIHVVSNWSTLPRNVAGFCEVDEKLGPHVHISPVLDHPAGDSVKSYDGGTRVIPIGPGVQALYFAWLEERATIREARLSPWLLVTLPGSPKVGPGQPVSADALRQRLSQMCETAGIRELTPHMLRHSAGEAMADAGVPVDTAQKVLGHLSLKSTAVYFSPSSAAITDAVLKTEGTP